MEYYPEEFLQLIFINLLIFIPVFLLMIVSNWKIYQKAGFNGWECIVPIYGYLVFLKIIGKPWYWILLLLLFPLTYIWIVWGNNLLSKRFGKDVGFTLGLLFLPYVFLPILAFSKAKYIPVGQEAPAEEPLTW
jgi:hypothetical protein